MVPGDTLKPPFRCKGPFLSCLSLSLSSYCAGFFNVTSIVFGSSSSVTTTSSSKTSAFSSSTYKYFIKDHNSNYYPTLLRRVQITRKTNTNITQYLYSCHSPDRAKFSKTLANFGETKTLDNKSLIRRFSV